VLFDAHSRPFEVPGGVPPSGMRGNMSTSYASEMSRLLSSTIVTWLGGFDFETPPSNGRPKPWRFPLRAVAPDRSARECGFIQIRSNFEVARCSIF
jgi:hypothetical protein